MAVHGTVPLSDASQAAAMVLTLPLQAMNGSRSAELHAPDAILDTGDTDMSADPAPQSAIQHTTAEVVSTAHPEHHLGNAMTSDAGMQHSRLLQPQVQQMHLQQPLQHAGLSAEAAHHRPAASWHQSEATTQEVASTSGSADSGTHFDLCASLLSFCCPPTFSAALQSQRRFCIMPALLALL